MSTLSFDGLVWKDASSNSDNEKRLVGQIISKKKINLMGIKEQLKAAWNPSADFVIRNIGFNLFSFTFNNVDDAKKVLNDGPWVARNHMLSIQPRGNYVGDDEIKISSCPFWVQLHNIPPEALLRHNLIYFGSQIRKVISVEMPGEGKFNYRKFGRMRIEVDINKPLIPGFFD